MKSMQFRWPVILLVVGFLLAACATPPLTPVPAGASATAAGQVVEGFYTWYLDYSAADPETGEFKNPLVDGAYKERQELAPQIVSGIEEALIQSGRPHADPFLCARDLPTSITVISENTASDEAIVTVRSSFEGHIFTIKLAKLDGEWKIVDVMCGRR